MVGGLKSIRVREGCEQEFERLFAELRGIMQSAEPGCRLYSLLRSRTSPRDYIVQEQYESQAALASHESSEHGARYFPRIRALLDLGHTVDLVTYPFGADIDLPGLRIFRAARPPFVRHVKIGPSSAKLFLDMTLTLTTLNRARLERYDAVHSHEEGAAIGVFVAGLLGIPHVYDMHSSLPQQLQNFSFSRSAILRWVFERLERTAITRSLIP